ncbi:conjugative transfer protein GumN [Azospira sp. I09]|nr:conjugative transfer protein GumN [Azospira sp. I09]
MFPATFHISRLSPRARCRRLLFAAVALLLSFQGQAQTPPDCPATQHAPPSAEETREYLKNARDHGFLWRIEKDGRASYLYGTVHVGKQEWLYPGPLMRRAMAETDTVALEMDVLDPAIAARIQQLMLFRKGPKLPAGLQERIRRQAEASCLPYAAIAALSPELQVVTLTVMLAKKEGLDPAYALDVMLAGFGHGTKRPVVSLEEPELQMKALHMKTPRETQAFVEASLNSLESEKALGALRRLAKAWEEGDYATMADYPAWCECMETPVERKAMQRLLNERNPDMAKRIDQLHRQGSRVFAGVGSLHLFGPTGLPALMQKKGYTVERIDFARP